MTLDAVGRMKLLMARLLEALLVLLAVRVCAVCGVACCDMAALTRTALRATLVRVGALLVWFSLKLALPKCTVRCPLPTLPLPVTFRTTTTCCPMLEPLLLLRLAGTGVRLADAPLTIRICGGMLFCIVSGRLLGDESTDTVCSGVLLTTIGIRLTVFVEAALLMDERDERRLFLELLRSTSRRTACIGEVWTL